MQLFNIKRINLSIRVTWPIKKTFQNVKIHRDIIFKSLMQKKKQDELGLKLNFHTAK